MAAPAQLPLSRMQLAAYALPSLPLALVVFPAYAILPGFYAQHTQLALATIGTIILVARAFDALVDPAIGYLSDASVTRWGRRKPWLVAGTLLLCIATPLLYIPGPGTTPTSYLVTLLAFYLGFSLIESPHKAWGTEISSDYRTRSLISTALAVAFALGTLTFALVPFVGSSSRGYDAATLERVAWLLVATLPVCTTLALWHVPAYGGATTDRSTPLVAFRAAVRNRPLRWFLVVFALTGLGQGLFYGLVYLLLTSVMPFGDRFAEFLLVDALATLAALPLWYIAVTRWSKHAAWAAGTLLQIVAFGVLLLLPAADAAYAWALAAVALRAAGGAIIYMAPGALLGDIIDYELLRHRRNLAANFHALVSLLTKGTSTIGGGVGLLLVGTLGFDPKSPSVSGAAALKVVSLVLPAALLLAAAALAWRFPLTRRRQSIVVRALARRTAREARV